MAVAGKHKFLEAINEKTDRWNDNDPGRGTRGTNGCRARPSRRVARTCSSTNRRLWTLEKISAALQLTPRQKAQLLPVIREEAPQLEAVKNDGSLGPVQNAMRLKQISTDVDAKVMPILNPMQQQKWQAMRDLERWTGEKVTTDVPSITNLLGSL